MRHRGSFIRPLPVILVIGSIAGVLTVSCTSGPLKDLNLISTGDEVKLGAQFSAELEKELTLLNDAEVHDYIDDLGQRLARNSQRTDIAYHIKVVNTADVNAFALPGGWLYVNRGLVETADNESELAGVMGHEIGHIVGRHGAKQMTRQYGLSLVIALALGQDPAMWQQVVADLLATGTLLEYGREAELEADRYGVEETHLTGINPDGIVTFFQELLAMHEREPGGLERLFATHPPTSERIAAAKGEIARLPSKTYTTDSERFRSIRGKLKSMPVPPDSPADRP